MRYQMVSIPTTGVMINNMIPSSRVSQEHFILLGMSSIIKTKREIEGLCPLSFSIVGMYVVVCMYMYVLYQR